MAGILDRIDLANQSGTTRRRIPIEILIAAFYLYIRGIYTAAQIQTALETEYGGAFTQDEIDDLTAIKAKIDATGSGPDAAEEKIAWLTELRILLPIMQKRRPSDSSLWVSHADVRTALGI